MSRASAIAKRRALGRAAALVAWAGVASCAAKQPERLMTVAASDGRRVSLDSATISYQEGAVRVIQRVNASTDVVAVNIYLLGGTRQLAVRTQGVEALWFRASQYGTRSYPGGATRRAWSRTGSHLTLEAEADWTLVGFRGVRQEFDSTWNILADRLMHPQLGAEGVTLARDKMLASLRSRIDHPDGYVSLLADSVGYAGHPYGLQPEGTEASLAVLDSAALARYGREQLVGSRLLVVVVGNVTRAQVAAAVRRTFAQLPAGTYAWTLPAAHARTVSTVAFLQRDVATNYILGSFRGPSASSPELPAFRMMTGWLSSRVSQAVREDRGMSYAAMAMYQDRGQVTGEIYVSTTAPRAVLPLIRAQIDSMQRMMTFGTVDMRPIAEQFILGYYGKNSTSAAQADFLGTAQLLRGDYRRATREMDDLRGVSMSMLRVSADKYLRDFQWVYLGDTTRVSRKVFEEP